MFNFPWRHNTSDNLPLKESDVKLPQKKKSGISNLLMKIKAVGYVNKDGNLNGWLSELAFVPVDYNKKAMVDEWSGFAALLANLIEKYAVVLNLDALPDLVIEEAVSEKDDADKNIHENDIEPVKAA